MPAKLEVDADLTQPFDLLADVPPHLAEGDARPAAGQQTSGRDTTARGTEHDDVGPAHGELGHRSFNVARLKQANTTATIRNRLITFGSLHPINSQ